MNDLISRKAAIEVAESHRVERPGFHLNDYEFGVTEAADAIASDLEDLPPAQQWIPCSERMPEDDTEVLVYLSDNTSPYIAWICDGRWYTEEFEVERENEPVAWMPLPEPYKAEERE